MTQFARPTQPCQAAPTPFSGPNLWLDVEVLAERYEDLLALPTLVDDPLEDELEETDDTDKEVSGELPF